MRVIHLSGREAHGGAIDRSRRTGSGLLDAPGADDSPRVAGQPGGRDPLGAPGAPEATGPPATGGPGADGSDGGADAYALTIGAYDGVHRGHRDLIARVRSSAEALGCASAVVTFDRHPATVVRPESAPQLLTDLDYKLELLATTGVDLTVVVHFDTDRAAEEPDDFVRTVLVETLRARSVVVGHDFHFGAGRRGNLALLARMGAEYGFDVTGLRLLAAGDDPVPVSSTRIRRLLSSGEVGAAAQLLGRPHQVRGVVEHGDRRGRELGFPTANVAVPADIMLPADGVYAGRYAGPDAAWIPAAISIGRRPTFYEEADLALLEVHLLDFDGDLYGQRAKVDFAARLRSQERYDGVDALIEQMRRDVEETRRQLGLRAG